MGIQEKTLQDLKSTVVFSRKLLFCMGQGGLWNRKELFKPSGRCLKSRARRGTRAPHVNMEFLWDFPEPEERSKAKWYPEWSYCTVGMLTIFVGVVVLRENMAFLLSWGQLPSLPWLCFCISMFLCPAGENINSYNLFTVLLDINVWFLHILS